ncbi:hypothetical protein OsI_29830 [Oryza sativa Indica Group]|uniref:Uncharacterized protein n=1 Tax=Oryza sativa subsp. indica TaxID=39946 RepID=A2YWW8_ORYSI|nr:hypothetical protein OsI_29830 [Oryza sativa Indica Group]
MSDVEVNGDNLVHIQLQPHLDEPPGTIDTGNFLVGVHLMNGLMKHVINTSQEIFPERDKCACSQVFGHYYVIQSWLIGFTTENKSAQPRIQKGPVFNVSQRTIMHAGYHVDIGQGWSHWSVTKEESIHAIGPEMTSCIRRFSFLGVSARDNSKQ